MKITIAKQDLERALAVAKISVSGDSDLSGHYLIRNRGGKIEILSYHQRIFSLSPVVATVVGEEGEAFTVEAWRLDKWVSGVPDGVIVLTSDGSGDVTCSGTRSKIKLRSLDASKFPFSDKMVAASVSQGKVVPSALARALSVSRWFVSGDDTSKPELCQIDAVKGVLWATDRRAFSSAEIPGAEELSIRVSSKDISALLKFLNEKGTTEGGLVEIKEASRAPSEGGASSLFYRADGSYFGVTRPNTTLPPLSKDNRDVPDSFSITIDHAEFALATQILLAAAPRGHERITFKNVEGAVVVSMPSEAGGTADYTLTLAVLENPEKFTMSFDIDYPYIQGLVSTFGGETLRLGCTSRGNGGYCTFHHFDNVEDEKAHGAIDEIKEVGPEAPPDTTLEAYKKLKWSGLPLKGNRYYTVVGWRS